MSTTFLKKLKDENMSVTVFLINGVKLQGHITSIEDDAILLKRDGHTQMVYKHSISTIMPSAVIDLG